MFHDGDGSFVSTGFNVAIPGGKSRHAVLACLGLQGVSDWRSNGRLFSSSASSSPIIHPECTEPHALTQYAFESVRVRVSCNGVLCPDVQAHVSESGRGSLYFREFLKEESEPQLSTQPSSALLSRLGLKLGENIVRFEILGLREDCACLPCVPQSSGTFMNSDVHGSTTDVSMDNGPIAGGGASGVTSSTTSSSSLSTSSLPQPHAFVDCSVWLYERDAQFLIFDIDGTITRSDVRGYIETIFLGMFGHTHSGVIDFAQQIRQAADSSERTDASADDTNRTSTGRKSGKALNMLYLTSRPISQLPETKGFLAKFHQGDSQCNLMVL